MLPKKIQQLLLSPVEYDPLNFVFYEDLKQVSAALEVNTIALIGDECAYDFQESASGQMLTVNGFLTRLDWVHNVNLAEDGWLTIEPKNRIASRDERVPRPAIGQGLSDLHGSGGMSLNKLAEFKLKTPTKPKSSGALLAGEMMLEWFQEGLDSSNHAELQLWGALSQGQRNNVLNGRGVPVVALSKKAQAILEFLVYEETASLVRQTNPWKFERESGVFGEMEATNDWKSEVVEIWDEPTELFPNGIPKDAVVVGRRSTEETAVLWVEGFSDASPLDIVFAVHYAFQNMEVGETARRFLVDMQVNLGHREMLDLRLLNRSGLGYEFEITQDFVDYDTPQFTLGELPASLKGSYSQFVANLTEEEIADIRRFFGS